MKKILPLVFLLVAAGLFAAEADPLKPQLGRVEAAVDKTVEERDALKAEVASLKAEVAGLQRTAAVLRQQRDAVTQQLNDVLAQAAISQPPAPAQPATPATKP